jgi:hypothetical protein
MEGWVLKYGGAVMKVTFSEKATQGPPLYKDLLQRAISQLEDVIGPSSTSVKAEWDQLQDELGPKYALRISDGTGSASTSFLPAELTLPLHMRVRLSRLWSELIQVRIDKQLQKVTQDGD